MWEAGRGGEGEGRDGGGGGGGGGDNHKTKRGKHDFSNLHEGPRLCARL